MARQYEYTKPVKGKSNTRTAPDERELTEETKPAAKRGVQREDSSVKSAATWLREADRNAELAVRYYRTAGDWYGRTGEHSALQQACYERATKIELLMGKADN